MNKTTIRARLLTLVDTLGGDTTTPRAAKIIERGVDELDAAMTAAHVDGRDLERETGASINPAAVRASWADKNILQRRSDIQAVTDALAAHRFQALQVDDDEALVKLLAWMKTNERRDAPWV